MRGHDLLLSLSFREGLPTRRGLGGEERVAIAGKLHNQSPVDTFWQDGLG
jgi:hypothetical protein